MSLLEQLGPELRFLASLRGKPSIPAGMSSERLWPLIARHQLETWLEPVISAWESEGIDAQAVSEFRAKNRSMAMRNLHLAGEMLRLLGRLRVKKITAIAYKGPTLEALVHGKLGCRKIQDLDFILPQADIAQAREMLGEDGYRVSLDLAPAQQETYAAQLGEVALYRPQDQMLVELHSQLAPTAFYFPLAFQAIACRLGTVAISGHEVPTLGREDLLLVLCAHHAKHGWTCLRWLYEVAGVLDGGALRDWDVLVARARELRSVRLLLLGIYLVEQILGYPVPAQVLREIQSDRALPSLAEEVVRLWTRPEGEQRQGLRLFLFHIKLRESFADGLRYAAFTAFAPNVADWQALRLPAGFAFLYYPFRMLRLAWKYATASRRK